MPVVIVGAGGHAKVVCDALLASGLPASDVLGYVDDDPDKVGNTVLGFPILGSLETLKVSEPLVLALGIGHNGTRQQIFLRARQLGYTFTTAVHPSAIVARDCRVGEGAAILAGAIVNSGTEIGTGVILNTASSVDHDCYIGAWAHIGPGARLAGGVRVGERTLIGVGTVVIPQISIGASSIIGAGAVVIRDVPSYCVAVGVPARVIKHGVGEDGD